MRNASQTCSGLPEAGFEIQSASPVQDCYALQPRFWRTLPSRAKGRTPVAARTGDHPPCSYLKYLFFYEYEAAIAM